MQEATIYYATNRRHQGDDQWKPSGYGIEPSKDGNENLRFGCVKVTYDKNQANECLQKDCGFGNGDGNKVAQYLLQQSSQAEIEAFKEDLDKRKEDISQEKDKFGSTRMFDELQKKMTEGTDILIYIHGFNVTWWQSVANALSLELMLNRHGDGPNNKGEPVVRVVLFSWPSDGRVIPWYSYFSDRSDGRSSGAAVGRGFLKVRDYLISLRRNLISQGDAPCNQSLHLLCHSMGNYIAQSALQRTEKFSTGGKPPRIFDQIFLCAPDVADDVFEAGEPMRRLPEMSQNVTIYHNKGDRAMPVSDFTKGNTDRLGWHGVNRPGDLDGRVHQVDCSPIVTGLIEHSYYLCGDVNDDIRKSIIGVSQDCSTRRREPLRHGWPNVWRIPKS